MKNFLLLTILFTFILVTFTACGKKEQKMEDLYDLVQQRKKIIVGITEDIKPFAYKSDEGVYQGFEIDLAKNIAKAILNDENAVEFVPLETSNRIMALNSGMVDMVISLMTITEHRAMVVNFSNSYYEAGQTVLLKKTSNIKSFSDLNQKRIGVIFGTTAEKSVPIIAPAAMIRGFRSYKDAVAALSEGSIDAVASDNTILSGFVFKDNSLKILPQRYTKEPYGIALRKGMETSRVLDMVNEVIIRMIADGSMNKLKEKWHIK